MELLYIGNFVILTSAVFDRSTRVMDGRATDGHTNRRAITYSALSICAMCCCALKRLLRLLKFDTTETTGNDLSFATLFL